MSDDSETLIIQGIDVEDGVARMLSNRAFYLQMLALFRDDQRDAAEKILDALNRDDRLCAERLAHTLKGVAGQVGAVAMQALAGQLETEIHRGAQSGALRPLLERLAADMSELQAAMARVLPPAAGVEESAAPAVGGIDRHAAHALLQRFAALLRDCDGEAMDAATELKKQTILIVDDTPDNISLLSALMKDQYKIKIATNGLKALQIAAQAPGPDLILLDVMMPEMDGYETCRRLKAQRDTADIPVIFLTAKSQVQDEEMGLKMGAVDFLTKPISPPIVLARVATQLNLMNARRFLADQNRHLEHLVAQRTEQLARMQDATILAMASLAETRDNETGNHIRRTQHFVATLARQLQAHPRFAAVLTEENIELLYKCAPLHDIGKVGVPDRILLKPGKLDPEEFEVMKLHTVYGRDTILSVEKHLGGSNGFLTFAREIAYSHQEKWDGSGYPEGLKGDAIPVSARLMAVADVYDAVISRRVYKAAFSHEQAVDIMGKGHGTQFDPDVLDAFLAVKDRFDAIAKQFSDGEMPD